MEGRGADTTTGQVSGGDRRRRLRHLAALGLVFAAGAVVRAYRIGDPPLDFHPTRQYRAALLARHYFFRNAGDVPQWRHEIAEINARERYEFPLLQYVAAIGYRLEGREDLRVPRGLSALSWLAGGVLLYLLGLRVTRPEGALVATALFVLLPFGVTASRAFHPDALMVALLLLSYLGLLAWAERGGVGLLLASAASCGATGLVKPMALFQLVAGFVAVWLARRKRHEKASVLDLAVFLVLVGAIAMTYYVAQWREASTLGAVAELSSMPHLLLTFAFWRGWLAQIWKVLGFVAPAAGLLGYLVLPRGNARSLIAGLTVGYSVFCLIFDYPAFTHDYYHLQLVPLLALAVAPFAGWLVDRLHDLRVPTLIAGGVLPVLFIAAVLDLATFSYYRERAGAFDAEVATYREVGELVGHGTANVLLANYYAYPLRYYGEIAGTYWPLSFDARASALMGKRPVGAAERLSALRAQQPVRYFIVTDMPEFAAQPDLASYLAANFAVRAATDRFVIYDLETPAAGGGKGPPPG